MAEPGENTMPEFPPRIHVLFAREADTAIIIRRGPSWHVCTMGWDRKSNTFSIGQWMKARIYERRSDLSPDGKWMIYFAMNSKWPSETGGSWTAISQAPYLKAVGLWAKGDCWNGGGLFINNTKFWINGGRYHRKIHRPAAATKLKETTDCPFDQHYGGECPGVYYPRLQRDGWEFVEQRPTTGTSAKAPVLTVFGKRASEYWTLRKIAHATLDHPEGKGCYYDQHQLVHIGSGRTLDFPDWEWADVDSRGIYWAEKGRLFMGQLGRNDLGDVVQLYDFHGMTFEPIKAPY